MKIASITSEAAPLAKSGGLADVASALADALSRLGHDVRLVMPLYGSMNTSQARLKRTGLCVQSVHGARKRTLRVWKGRLPGSRVTLYALEAPALYARLGIYVQRNGKEYKDNLERFSALCQGALDLFPKLDWIPDVLHCHDWISSLAAVHLKQRSKRKKGFYRRTASVLTVHNLSYPGAFPLGQWPAAGLPDRGPAARALQWKGRIHCLRGGLLSATRLTTVSPTYAREIQTAEHGCGFERLLVRRKRHLTGVLNGIDQKAWDPASDRYLAARYSARNLSGKRKCKTALRRQLALADDGSLVLGMVQRIVEQKGLDVLLEAAEALAGLPVQLAVLGTGEPRYEGALRRLQQQHPGQFAVRIAFDERLAHAIEAGSDAFLMPSRFEPCGLNQLYSLRYGTVPVVRRTGGLADTVCNATPRTLARRTATGIVFQGYTAKALVSAVRRAVALFRKPRVWDLLVQTGMKQEFSWKRSAGSYVRIYRQAFLENAGSIKAGR